MSYILTQIPPSKSPVGTLLKQQREEILVRGYQEMAAKEQGEREALEWIEVGIGETL